MSWREIDRYRSPGNYGITDFIQPQVFDDLVAAGVLERAAGDSGRLRPDVSGSAIFDGRGIRALTAHDVRGPFADYWLRRAGWDRV